MAESNDTLTLFTTRARQMILQYNQLKSENDQLYAMVDEKDEEIKRLKALQEQSCRDLEAMKTARMVELTSGDIEGAKRRLASLIREVNKSITLLSEK